MNEKLNRIKDNLKLILAKEAHIFSVRLKIQGDIARLLKLDTDHDSLNKLLYIVRTGKHYEALFILEKMFDEVSRNLENHRKVPRLFSVSCDCGEINRLQEVCPDESFDWCAECLSLKVSKDQ